ncbi:hypothetical protein NFI96_005774 [Prochilodus magdalenae]|nr:hypothetical protein NFI96_005774 [Prochilodus magdalenae]
MQWKQPDPAVSVINSSVNGQEGGSVIVQCFYSAGYKNKQKQWCRFKDGSCYTVGRPVTSQNPTVQISDDGKRSVSVEMSGLQKSDAGWYWFSAEEVGVTVHLTVTERPTTTTAVTTVSATKKTSTSTTSGSTVTVKTPTKQSGRNMVVWILLAVGLGLLLILLSIITWMMRTKSTEGTEVMYSTVITTKNKPPSAAAQENDVIYANVNKTSTNKALSPADGGDDGVVYSSVVHNTLFQLQDEPGARPDHMQRRHCTILQVRQG